MSGTTYTSASYSFSSDTSVTYAAVNVATLTINGHGTGGTDGVTGGEFIITGNLDPSVTGHNTQAYGGYGTVNVDNAELVTEGSMGYNTINLSNATLDLANSSASQNDKDVTINFAAGTTNNVIVSTNAYSDGFGNATSDAPKLTGFTSSDSLTFASAPTSASYSSSTGVLTVVDGGKTYYFDTTFASGSGDTGFKIVGDTVVASTACYASGARILTTWGYVAVEDLAIGDVVVTARENGPQTQKIIWVGSRTLDLTRHADPEKVQPICIKAGAFAPGMPERDLRVSPDHALYIDGALIEAKNLVNGVTIIQELDTKRVTYHHIELAQHDVMLAEGVPAESYLDTGNRVMFENEGPMVLHPDFGAAGREGACAPLLLNGEIVIAARQRLLDRAVSLGYGLTDELDLMARANGRALPVAANGQTLTITVPAGATSVDLISAVGVPAEISANPGDRRRLGVSVAGLTLVTAAGRTVIALDDTAHSGFHGLETTGETSYRWTNGEAKVALPAAHQGGLLEVTLLGGMARWVEAKRRTAIAV